MYYFGTNLDNRFSVPDFWPKPDETHRIPFEREDIGRELGRLRERRLRLREERLRREGGEGGEGGDVSAGGGERGGAMTGGEFAQAGRDGE